MKMKTFLRELIAQILSLLPVNPLLRFQCVSKLWFALINDSYFIKLHLNRSKERFLILETFLPPNYSIVNFSDEDQFGTAVNIKHPLHNLKYPNIVASCNGLVCISNYDNEVEDIVIWNPLIRKYKNLPSKPTKFFGYKPPLAFGYDQVNDDYKVLRFVKLGRKYSHEIYSLREQSWRMVEEEWPIEEQFEILWLPPFLNGAFHWAVSYRTHLKIDHVTFDLSTEKFRVQAFPINSSIKTHVNLVDLGGWLCAVFSKLCEVWVMKEYGVASSWTLLYAAKPSSKSQPLVFSHNGEEVLTGEVNNLSYFLYWYDIKRKIKKIVEIQNIPELYRPVICVESLILLDDDSCNYLQ